MNKRSAMFVAAGLVLTMVVAAAAMTMGIAGPDKASARVTGRKHRDPIVKKVVDTVTVHKKAPSGASTFTTVRTAAPAAATTDERAKPSDEHESAPKQAPSPQQQDDGSAADPSDESSDVPEPSESPSAEPSDHGWEHDDD
jgi:hypothetical protein